MNLDGMTAEQAAEEAILLRTQEAIDPQADVHEFMAAFGQALPSRPQWPDEKTMDLRVKLKAEELVEWLRDSGYECIGRIGRTYERDGKEFFLQVYSFDQMESDSRSLPKSADALIDDLYVTFGALLAMGIDMWPLWREVHAKNMAKKGGPVVDGKQMKPAGWTPPDIDALLRKQGWEGE